MSPVELILRVVGVALLALVVLSVLRTRERTHRTRSVAWFAASLAAFLLTSMPGAERIFGAFVYPLTALCSTHPVWFWICARLLFSDRATLRTSDVICLGAMGVAGVLYQSQFPVPADESATPVRLLGLAFAASSMAFACLAPLTVQLGMAGDLDAQRRRLRQWFVPVASLYLAAVVLTQVIVLLQGRSTPRSLVLLNLLVIDAAALLALSSFVQWRVVNWIAAVDAPPAIALSKLEQSVLDRLDARFVTERLYAREALTIVALADLLGTQEHVLRRVINHGLGFRNFNDFLHTHRLTEAAARLRDPQLQRIAVLTIALDVGYGSIGPFNRAFKERFGATPTEYRRAQAAPAGLQRTGDAQSARSSSL
ncbi:MAG TPA: helix-turn-helix transcriptional regulator [Steroidobacteraceae bacterium]|nr:helix-turn-helix transcriptional regulator [Steroidobacteraceae bacterium]